MSIHNTLTSALIAILFFCSSCKRDNVKDTTQSNGSDFTLEEQALISSRILDAILANTSEFPLLDQSSHDTAYLHLQTILNEAINTAQVTKRNALSKEVYILNDDEKGHAFFLPGGEFFIHTGLLKYLDNYAELLAVIAHEIAYVEQDLVIENLKTGFSAVTLNELAKGRSVDNLEEIGEYFKTIEYKSSETIYADSFSVSLICPFSYEPLSLKNLVFKIRDNNDRIDWEFRKEADPEKRFMMIDEVLGQNMNCLENSSPVTRTEEYNEFKNLLP